MTGKCDNCGNVVSYKTHHSCVNGKGQLTNRLGPAKKATKLIVYAAPSMKFVGNPKERYNHMSQSTNCICPIIWEPDSYHVCRPVRYVDHQCPQHCFIIDTLLPPIPDLWPDDLFKEIDNLFTE